jgi:4-hydroxybenzoate polyprenyltransferase
MSNISFFKSFYNYQKERFPIFVLSLTTIAVILSSAAIVIEYGEPISKYLKQIIISFITVLLFTFHIRVIDDYKDYLFDLKYHSDRPIQSGVIKIKTLLIIDVIGLFIQAILNLYFSIEAFIWWLIAFSYTILATNEFFIGEKIKRNFFLYNFLNLIQLLILQFYIYAIIYPSFILTDKLLIIHFIFVMFNITLLEFGRKLKSKEEENIGKDTYSSRLGIARATIIYIIISLVIYYIFNFILFNLQYKMFILMLSLIPLNLLLISSIIYLKINNALSSKILEICAILFYLSMHLLFIFTIL